MSNDLDNVTGGLLQPQIKKLESGDEVSQGVACLLKAMPVILSEIRETKDVITEIKESNTVSAKTQIDHSDRLQKMEAMCAKCDQAELMRVIEDRKFFRRVFIYGGSAASLALTVFGLVIWEKFQYVSKIDDEYLKSIVRATLIELQVIQSKP
jgi:hypothetical protein